MCMCVCAHVYGCLWKPEGCLRCPALQLELPAVANCLIRMLGIKLGPLARAISALNSLAVCLAPIVGLLYYSHPGGYEMVFHCGIDLYFPDN